MQIPFFRPYIDEKERELVNAALDGDPRANASAFEKMAQDYFGCKHAIATISGTAAKHLALCALGIKRGDKIICPVISFVSVAEVIRYFDAEPVFVDVNEDDFTINIDALEEVIKKNKSKKLKAIFVTHLGGQAAQMDEIRTIAKLHGIKVIDDAPLGARYKKKLIGAKDSFISCFGAQHQTRSYLSAAGLMLTNDDEIAQNARLIRSHAIKQSSFDKEGNLGYFYDVENIGQRYDLSALCAAFSIAQFSKLDSCIKKNKQIASIYDAQLANTAHISIPVARRDHIYTQYIIKVDKNRDGFAKELVANGIKVGLHYIPLYLLGYYKQKYGYKIGDFPNALRVYQQVLSLPIYGSLSDDEIAYICKSVKMVASTRV